MLMQMKYVLWKLLLVAVVAMIYAEFSGAAELSETDIQPTNSAEKKQSNESKEIGFRCPGKLFAIRAGCHKIPKNENQEAIQKESKKNPESK